MPTNRPRVEILAYLALIASSACQQAPSAGPGERIITLPGGRQIVAEVLIRPEDMARGMMYRESLPPDRGLLFLHSQPGRYPYWMHNVKVPLDIIWMDRGGRVVEVSAGTPPCDGKPAGDCPSFGGAEVSEAVLEIGSGLAAEYGIRAGVVIRY